MSKKIDTSVIVFFLILSVPVLSVGIDAPAVSAIKKVRGSLNSIKPFSVEFVQQVSTESDNDSQVDVEESGAILFKNDSEVKWTYRKPDYKVFLLEGSDYRFYDRDNEQLTIGKIKDRNRQWIWQLLFSDDIFRYASDRKQGNQNIIRIKNDRESLDVEITVDSNFLPVKMIQVDSSGARMIYHFKNYKVNITIPGDAFKLDIPKDTEVVNEEEKENPGN
jgi:outer membrane lipoprotein-sorting protein